jgi:hypothetical protein
MCEDAVSAGTRQLYAELERADAPIDWAARFRAAADVAATGGAHQLRRIAAWLEQQPPSRVEAIGRELLGEAP